MRKRSRSTNISYSSTYIMTDITRLVKIGRTENIKKRLHGIKAMNTTIKLLISIPYDIEKQLHKIFDEYREIGEWFRREDRLADFITEALLNVDQAVFNLDILKPITTIQAQATQPKKVIKLYTGYSPTAPRQLKSKPKIKPELAKLWEIKLPKPDYRTWGKLAIF